MDKAITYPRYPFLLLVIFLFPGNTGNAFAQEGRQIDILHSEYLEYDRNVGTGVVKYVGDVAFRQENMYLYCDSAHLFTRENTVNAYGNVHIVQGDTLHLYGDLLKYFGNTKMAEIRRNVTLIDRETTLTTQSLDFDLKNNIGFYEHHGHVISGDNVLDSRAGYYYSRSKDLYFRDSVVIVNPDYTIYADTLRYNTVGEVAHFLGPTRIISPDNYIYCENGWYDTRNNISQFNRNAWLESEGQILSGDSLYYERDTGTGRAFDNVELYDSVRNVILRGKYALYTEEPEYALLTDSAEFLQISGEDTLYLHSDTIRSVPDTSGQHKVVKAWNRVKFYRTDIQGKCDSLVYLEGDSVFHLLGEPVLWSEEHQLTADQIFIHLANEKPDYIEMNNSAFIISQDDSIRFNQIQGRQMTGYFIEDQLSRIHVEGNGQTLYYARDSTELIGINKAISGNLNIYIDEGKIKRIVFISQPSGTLYPPGGLPDDQLYLGGFVWLDRYRPRRKEEIFDWTGD